MNNHFIRLLLSLVVLSLHAGAIAQGAQAAQSPQTAAQSAGPKIGFANLNRILVESDTAKTARAGLEREFASRLEALRKLSDSLRAAQAELEKNGPTLSAAARQQQERELVAMDTDFQRRKREYDEDYDVRQREVTAEFNNKVGNVVRKVAVAEHYDMMFQEAVWWNPAIDITDKIIKELDAAEAASKAR